MSGYSGRHIASCTCWMGSSSSVWARPSAEAAVATAIATAADTARSWLIGGSSGAPGVAASAAAAIIRSPGFGDSDPKSESGKDEGVVGLGDVVVRSW